MDVKKNMLGHILMGWWVMALAAVPAGAFFGALVWRGLIGLLLAAICALFVMWLAQSFYWLAREVRDHELAEKEKGREISHGWRALLAFAIWLWNKDGKRDLLAPALVNGALIGMTIWYVGKALL